MSLEDSINKLADAINNLANAYVKEQTLHVTIPQTITTSSTTAEAPAPNEEPKRPRGRPPGTTKPKPIEAAPPPPPAADPVEEDELDATPTAREYTMDDVRKACLALRDHDGGDKTRALDVLKRIAAAASVPDVKPVHYAEVVEECERLMQS